MRSRSEVPIIPSGRDVASTGHRWWTSSPIVIGTSLTLRNRLLGIQ
ncbi:MAG: hypothetical protein HY762_02025 [Planctomycetes bacterium]|nr:hypothetical protein [Planctomycetota bacterium]